jgi:hypothetical protein
MNKEPESQKEAHSSYFTANTLHHHFLRLGQKHSACLGAKLKIDFLS